jgi:hypothetical protein
MGVIIPYFWFSDVSPHEEKVFENRFFRKSSTDGIIPAS